MTKLQIPDPPDVNVLRETVRVRLPVKGDAGVTDDRWRRVYNDLASGAGLPADALGSDNRTVLIVELPVSLSAEEVAARLTNAGNLLGEADKRRQTELDRRSNGTVAVAARKWCNDNRTNSSS